MRRMPADGIADPRQGAAVGRKRGPGRRHGFKKVYPVQGNEGRQAHEQDGTGYDDHGQFGKLPPVVAAGFFGGVGGPPRGGSGRLREMGDLVEQDGGGRQRDEPEYRRPVHAEVGDGGRREQRAEHEAAVAADGEEAQARALGGPGNLVGEARAFGMEQRRPDAAQGEYREDGPVGVEETGRRHSAPGEQHAQRDEPRLGKPVREIAEHRLDDGGETGIGEHQPGGGLVVESVRRDQERQQGGQGPAVHVARQMAQ